MKERVLELLEELVGAHSYGAKRSRADEIAALVKTAVFPADQADAGEISEAELRKRGTLEDPLYAKLQGVNVGTVSGELTGGNLLVMPQGEQTSECKAMQWAAAQQGPGDPEAENEAPSGDAQKD